MYRCDVCNHVSKPGEIRLVHRVLRPDGSIHKEVPVCKGCHHHLTADGFDLATVQELVRQKAQQVNAPSAVVSGLPNPYRNKPVVDLAGKVTHLAGIPVANGGKGHAPTAATKEVPKELKAEPLCDVCSAPALPDGQVTADTVLCKRHLKNRRKP